MRHVICVLAVALLARAADPEPKGPELKVRKITAGSLRLPFNRAFEPVKIASAEELAKAVPDKAAQEELKKHANFTREYLLVFTWAGSGGDKLTYTVEKGKKGPEAVFKRTRGFTKDLRRHQKVYALPKAMAYRLEK